MGTKQAIIILALVTLVSGPISYGQTKRRPHRASHSTHTTLVRTGESVEMVALRTHTSSEEVARLNGLAPNSRLRRGQRLTIPPQKETPPVRHNGEPIGQRITFADGRTIDVDAVWKQGETTWYRSHGTSQSLTDGVKSIENRYREESSGASSGIATGTVKPEAARTQITWVYLVDGAKLRVDELREVNDGAWYSRSKLNIFLARERIARIEREDPGTVDSNWKDHSWSSGSILIDQMIRSNASRAGIDPYLVFLVIEQESHFRAGIVSPKGAQGLMQLMPGTARRFGVRRPFDPAENIRGGTQYLKQLLDMFNGRVDLALASYNAGEGRVLDYGNRVPPFKETRDYVKRISNKYRNH